MQPGGWADGAVAAASECEPVISCELVDGPAGAGTVAAAAQEGGLEGRSLGNALEEWAGEGAADADAVAAHEDAPADAQEGQQVPGEVQRPPSAAEPAVPAGLPQVEAGPAGDPSSEESSLSLPSASSSSSLEFVSLPRGCAWSQSPERRRGAPAAAAAVFGASPACDGSGAASSRFGRSPAARLSPQQLRRLGMYRAR